jgi:hypothetical protein
MRRTYFSYYLQRYPFDRNVENYETILLLYFEFCFIGVFMSVSIRYLTCLDVMFGYFWLTIGI